MRKRELDGSDIFDGLASLGIPHETINRDEVKVHCLNPEHADNNPSMHINIGANAGAFKCWSCGFTGHIITIFKDMGYDPFDEDISLSEQTRRAMNRVKVKQRAEHPKTSNFFLPGTLWDKGDWRGIPGRVLTETFQARHWTHTYKDGGIRHDSEGRPVERILFPVFFRKLYYGFAARYLGNDPTIDDKYYNDPALPTKHLLYPYDLVIPRSPIILVEGPFDAIRLRFLGYNGLCVFGTQNWSTSKIMAILRYRPTQIILMFDPDEAGQKAVKIIYKSLLEYVVEEKIVQFPMLPNYDPGDVPEQYLLSTLVGVPRRPL